MNQWIAYCWISLLLYGNFARADLDDMDPIAPVEKKEEIAPISKSLTVPIPSDSAESPTKKNSINSRQGNSSGKKNNGDPSKGKQIKTTPSSSSRSEPINWKSKGLKAAKDKGIVELNNDVQVVQGELELTSNYAKIFRDEVAKEVSKVLVVGNVKITKSSLDPAERVVGTGNEAVFLNADRKVILKGNAKLVRGEDILRGKQITYELDTGWISVDNVDGVMQPNEKDKEKTKK